MLQLTDSSFGQILEKNFHLLEKSSVGVEDSQIIFLGNTHYLQEQQWKISWLIQQLYQEGDIVLVESSNDNPESCSETQFVAKKINLKGWDSKLREKENEEKECLISLLLHIDHVRKYGLTHDDWIKDIHRFLRMFPPVKELHDEIIGDICSKERLVKLNSPEERLEYFNDIVFAVAATWLKYLQNKLTDDLLERNDCMIRTIDTNLPKSARIFVISGIMHLTLDKRFNHDLENTTDSIKLVHKYCSDKKYVVLYPNANNEDLQKIKEELKPSLGVLFNRFITKADYSTIAKVVLVGSVLCLGMAAISLPLLVYQKVRRYFTVSDTYHQSLNKLPIEALMVLISYAAENENSLPRQVGITPLKGRLGSLLE